MANGGVSYKTEARGKLHRIDELAAGDPQVGNVIASYADTLNQNRQSLHWQRAVRWIENIFFSTGRHYVDDILVSRLANSSDSGVGDLSIIQETSKQIPKPTNDLLGRYIETNVALLTENRPRPRVDAKSDKDEDQTAAELSELTLEYLWEALKMPEKHREMARQSLHTGATWLEIVWDPTVPRRVFIPQTKNETQVVFPEGTEQLDTQILQRPVPVVDAQGNPVLEEDVEFGDVVANIVSAFQMHMPPVHYWNGDDMGWIMKEEFLPIEVLRDKYYRVPAKKGVFTKQNGWDLAVLKEAKSENVTSLPLWWFERIAELVEGPGPSIYIGSPEMWEGYTLVRTFDRKPSPEWPNGRTIITIGDKVLYDSPKKVGARAYDKRWPDRWHPYIRYRWEAQVASPHGRSLISKLLPKLKRVNAIDTTLIMWRRTVPIATWTAPKGSTVVEDHWTGRPGMIWEYDPRRTATNKPEPVYPPPYPAAALEERQQQIAEMESIAGTEQILRGERPIGVNSAMMIDILRKQALASRSAILQAWDESLQECGTALLQTVIRYVRNDPRYAERIRILARERDYSRVSIQQFSGEDLSDNVAVRVDTASMALVSKEARQAKVVEILQYLPNLMTIEDIGLRQAILDELDLKKALMPSGPDVNRARKNISLIRNNRTALVHILPDDDPYIHRAMLINEMKSDGFIDLGPEQQAAIIQLKDIYERQIKLREMAQQQMMEAQMQMQAAIGGGGQ